MKQLQGEPKPGFRNTSFSSTVPDRNERISPPSAGILDISLLDLMKLDTPILFIATTEPQRARRFYEESLGLEFVADEPYALVFRVGEIPLRIQKVEQKAAAGHTVLGWKVSDIRKTMAGLREAGVEFVRLEGLEQSAEGIWRSPSGAQIAWFRDPDGNTLSLTEPV
jgi:catechol 2,3-dioxygenase-like lactoylglutathione lyase family enzyme